MGLQIARTSGANTDHIDYSIVIKEWSELHNIVGYLIIPISSLS